VRSARNVAHALALTPRDRCLNVMPLFHIHGIVGALLASLAAGGSVVCTPGLVAGQFLVWLAAFRPTWYTAVPTLHQAVLAELAAAPAGAARGILRLARSSSASLPPAVARDLESAIGAPVIEAYGMTEAAHQIASNPLPPRPRKPGSVGLPAGPEIAIMDTDGRILPPGRPGEIVIRGSNVMSGYRANAEANRTAFANGWFRTGDEGVLDADGYLSITGRLKEMINRGGEKIAPREVDEALLEHPAVGQAVAFAVAHPTLGEDVAAAVVLKPGARATGSELREHLFGRLVEQKIPSRVVVVDAIPKGPTGKVQRIGLAQRLTDQLGTERVAPRTEAERTVSEVFAEVLGVGEVCATDNFFALGGDSLRGGQVLARLRARLGVSLRPTQLFRSPTVEEFAREVAAHES
jgi:acyl-CoA synthetase (AMP-forming)/AMP-acid ligase II/aryl carrier-like protein